MRTDKQHLQKEIIKDLSRLYSLYKLYACKNIIGQFEETYFISSVIMSSMKFIIMMHGILQTLLYALYDIE